MIAIFYFILAPAICIFIIVIVLYKKLQSDKTNYVKYNRIVSILQDIYYNKVSPKEAKYIIQSELPKRKYKVIELLLFELLNTGHKETDIKFSLASTYIYQNRIDLALETFLNIIENNPYHYNARLCALVLYKINNEMESYNEQLNYLNKIDIDKTNDILKILNSIDQIVHYKFCNTNHNVKTDEKHAFVILGYELTDDGLIQNTLYERLNVLKGTINHLAHSKIIVSGGATKNDVSEAEAMYNWLISNDFNSNLIFKEDKSNSTIDNALFSAQLIVDLNISNYTIVTSSSHIRRSLALFNTAFLYKHPKSKITYDLKPSYLLYFDKPIKQINTITDKEVLSIYRDVLRAIDIHLYPIFPDK